MANEIYEPEVSPSAIRLIDEEEQGLHAVSNGQVRSHNGRNKNVGNGRDKLTMAEMKVQMSAFWKEGLTYAEIADRVSDEFSLEGDDRLQTNNISKHIASLLKTARGQAALHINERMALVLARYDQIEMLVTEAYFASMSSETTNWERMIKQARSKTREKQLAEEIKRERVKLEVLNANRKNGHRKMIESSFDHVIGDLPDLMVLTNENVKEYTRREVKPAGDPRFIAQLIDINDRRAKLWHLLDKTGAMNPDQDMAKLPDEERRSRMVAVLHAAMTRRTGDTGTLAPPTPLGGFPEGEIPLEARIQVIDPEDVEEDEIEWD